MPSNPADPTKPMESQVPPEVMAPAPSGTSRYLGRAEVAFARPLVMAAQETAPFLVKQDASELLAANLIGQTVMTANNELIGEVTDLITDKDGKILAVLIGAGFLGIGEKDVAIRFEDITVTRDENNDLTVTANVTKEMVAQAPDYQTLDEQQIIMGREERSRGQLAIARFLALQAEKGARLPLRTRGRALSLAPSSGLGDHQPEDGEHRQEGRPAKPEPDA